MVTRYISWLVQNLALAGSLVLAGLAIVGRAMG
jgi:hypothetical protein